MARLTPDKLANSHSQTTKTYQPRRLSFSRFTESRFWLFSSFAAQKSKRLFGRRAGEQLGSECRCQKQP
jgi:hypothetical protein